MLKQVRHISEGNFYGLRVTNKVRKLSLDKELRTLEACKDVQSHVYRKEEKELINTLKRLHQTKHDHLDPQEDHEHPARLTSHHDRRASFHSKHPSRDEHRHLRRPTERHDGKVQVKVRSEGSDHVKVLANASNVSVIISLSPIASSVGAAKQTATGSLPPVAQTPKKEAGTDIHRTQAFMSCVICNLPRYTQGRENNNTCTCHADPSKHPHPGHKHQGGSNKRRMSHPDDEDLKKWAAKRERRRSLEVDDLPTLHSAKKHPEAHHRHNGRSRASSFEEDNKPHGAPERTRAFDEYTAYVPGVGAHRRNFLDHNITSTDHHAHKQGMRSRGSSFGEKTDPIIHEQGMRSRGTSFGESRSRRNSLDEGRSRWGSYSEGRSRDNSLSDRDEPHYMRPLKGHYGSRHNRARQEEELREIYSRLQRVFHHGENGDHPQATQLPLAKTRRDAAAHTSAEDPAPAFSGLMHPDNIFNHHHFLPYEAGKQDKHRTTNHQVLHPPPQPNAHHVTGIDRHGNRQEVSDFSSLDRSSKAIYTPLLTSLLLAVYRTYIHEGRWLEYQTGCREFD